MIQFNSYCCGVPDEQPIRNAIHEWLIQEKISKLIAWKLAPMGKEGEYWICFEANRTFHSLKPNLIEAISRISNQPQDKGGISIDSNRVIDPVSLPKQAKWEKIIFE